MSAVLFHDVYAMVHQPRLAKRIYFMHRRHIYTMMRKATDPYATHRAVRAYQRPGITKYGLDTISHQNRRMGPFPERSNF